MLVSFIFITRIFRDIPVDGCVFVVVHRFDFYLGIPGWTRVDELVFRQVLVHDVLQDTIMSTLVLVGYEFLAVAE